jgi:hypothetical protein
VALTVGSVARPNFSSIVGWDGMHFWKGCGLVLEVL